MTLFNKIKASAKLYVMVLITAIFIIGIGLYAVSEIKKMNQNTETLYADRVLPMEQLETIMFSYSVGILSSVQQLHDHQITFHEAQDIVEKSEEQIALQWKAYMYTYLTPEEEQLAGQASVLMGKSTETIKRLKGILKNEDKLALDSLVNNEFYPAINPVISQMNELIALQGIVSREIYLKNAEVYSAASKRFYILMGLSLFLIFVFSVYIVRNVNDLIANLRASNKKLTESEGKYRTIFENSPDIILIINKDFKIESINHSSPKGPSIDEIIGIDSIQGIPEESREVVREAIDACFATGKNQEVENALHFGRWSRSRFVPIKSNGAISHLMIISADITQRRLIEQERDKIIADLIQRNKNFEQFAFIISHNLRAPVASILGLGGLLKYSLTDEDRIQAQELLIKEVQHFDEIVKDLNNVLQLRNEIAENKEVVHLSELVLNIESSIRNLIRSHHAKIVTDFSAIDEVSTLKSYLQSIFYNLISNGIKFAKPDTEVVVEIKSVIKKDKIRISFKDNGRGIDLERHGENMFGLYKRFHLNVEGKGLGLFMVKTQIEVLGGSIQVKSQPDIGTEFIVEFPI
jgi:PAS domain S-box-containing protein